MSQDLFEIVPLKSGFNSLRLRENNETFHPVIGPAAEASILHVQQQKLKEQADRPGRLLIWDVGLGAAANAISILEALQNPLAEVELHSFDKTLDPLYFAIQNAEALQYLLPHRQLLSQLIDSKMVQVRKNFRWHFHLGDFREQMLRSDLESPHSIIYDPYSARGNQEMWTLEHFTSLRKRLDDDRACLLTNYTRSTAIRCTLLMAGFYVGVGTAIGEKEQSTIASNQLAALDHPLSRSWLRVVPASQNANPIRESTMQYGPMALEDYRLLNAHPQFRLNA